METNTKNPHNLQVGQKVWCVASRRVNFFATIEKMGTKWAYSKDLPRDAKIDIMSLAIVVKDFGRIGKCHLSKEEYEAEQARLDKWRVFRLKVNDIYTCPKSITMDMIDQVMKILGLKD